MGKHRLAAASSSHLQIRSDTHTHLLAWSQEFKGSFQYMLRLYRLAVADPTLETLFRAYAKRGASGLELSLDDFRSFWWHEQRTEADPSNDEGEWYQEATDLFMMACASEKRHLSFADFLMLMLSQANSALHPKHTRVHQDMSYPLSRYYINSSHNTYITGNQFNSASSADMYRRVIAMGCRCVEVDVHDGEGGEPEACE